MAVKDQIKKRRAQLDMTLDEVAQKIGVTRATVQKYESGTITNIPYKKIIALAAALDVTPAYIMGWDDPNAIKLKGEMPITSSYMVPVVASVRAGYGGIAIEDYDGYEPVYDRQNCETCVWLKVRGDSMYPMIMDGDLVLVNKQPDLENGEIGVVIYNGEEGTVKRVSKQSGALVLTPANSAYETKVIVGTDLENVMIYGKVVEIKRKL